MVVMTMLVLDSPWTMRSPFATAKGQRVADQITEMTIADLVDHAKRSVRSKYIQTLDTALIMAADAIAGNIQGLLDVKEFKQTAYALDRDSRKSRPRTLSPESRGRGEAWRGRGTPCRIV